MKSTFFYKLVCVSLLSFSGSTKLIAQTAAETDVSSGLSAYELFYGLLAVAVFLLILIMALAGVYKSLLSGKSIIDAKKTDSGKSILILTALIMLPGLLMAQEAGQSVSSGVDSWLWMMITLDAFLLLVVFLMLRGIKKLVRMASGISLEEEEAKPDLYDVWEKKLTGAVPIEREGEIMLDHDYDGIKELDNNLPPWWVYMFYATIIFAFAYIGYYHFTPGKLQADEYLNEMAEAAIAKEEFMKNAANLVDESNVELLTESSRIEAGKSIYLQNCAACHGQGGEGGVGPNLVDDYWMYGGSLSDVFKSIKYGIPAKGMIAWQNQLGAAQLQEVSSFIMTLKGTNPENQKEAQGDLWMPEKIVQDSASVSVADTVIAGLEIK